MDVTNSVLDGRSVSEVATSAVKSVYSLVILLVLWEVVGQLELIHYYFLPPLSDVLGLFWELTVTGEMLHHTYLTLKRAMSGLAIAIALGVPIGVLSARSRLVGWFFNPIIAVGYPVPIIALIPVFILWFGIGDVSKLLLVALGTFWPVAVNARNSTQNVDENLLWSARMMGTTDRRLFWKVVIPATIPEILTGIRQAIPFAFISLISAELIASEQGMGRLIRDAGSIGRYPAMFATIVIISAVAYTAVYGFEQIRERVLVWT